MDIRFLQHNSHLEGRENFLEVDPELCQLKSLSLKYNSPILEKLPTETPGIYTLSGGHRVGKTTLLKQWMEKLMWSGVTENAIAFFSGELISDYHEFKNLLHKQIPNMPTDKVIYIIVDDVNYIRDWEKGIKPLIESAELNQAVLMLSSSARTLAEDTNNYFPEKFKLEKSFHLYPLSFHETIILKNVDLEKPKILFDEFNQYLIHGGYLNTINDIKMYGTISDKLISSYTDWLRKETVRHGKQERFLREILNAIVKHFNNQTTWNALAQELTIDHPKTIGDYFAFLESIDVVFIQYALLEESLKAAPKKARKLMFTDPFIFHAVQAWLSSSGKNCYEKQIIPALNNPELCSRLVETSVITQFSRYYPTYYIKAEGEVELAYVQDERFWPIEITWESQMRAKDLKQILKYPNGRILTKTDRSGIIQHIRTEPLPLALWQLKDLIKN